MRDENIPGSGELAGVLIDTDVVSFVFKGDPKALLFDPYLQGSTIYISFASIGELYYGAYNDN